MASRGLLMIIGVILVTGCSIELNQTININNNQLNYGKHRNNDRSKQPNAGAGSNRRNTVHSRKTRRKVVFDNGEIQIDRDITKFRRVQRSSKRRKLDKNNANY